MQASSEAILPPYPFILIPAIWVVITFVSSLTGGWFALSERFTRHSEPSGETRSAGFLFYSVFMRFRGNYSGIIRFTTAEDALYLSVFFLFRLGHPPLRIPWEEITVVRDRFLWNDYVVLTLGNAEQIPMRMSESLAYKLGIQDHFPEAKLVPGPSFDTLSKDFVDSQSKRWYSKT